MQTVTVQPPSRALLVPSIALSASSEAFPVRLSSSLQGAAPSEALPASSDAPLGLSGALPVPSEAFPVFFFQAKALPALSRAVPAPVKALSTAY